MALMGRNASVSTNAGANTVADLYNWKIDLTSNPITQPVFGDTWSKTHGLGVNAWAGSFDGIYSNTDTEGQVYFQTAQISGTLVSGTRFEMDASTSYYSGDLYITGHSITADPEDVIKVTYSFQGTGALTLTV